MRVTVVFVSLLASAALVGAALGLGCSSSSGNGAGTETDGGGDECAKIDSACGQPCDPGNSLGIGKFCNNIHDCEGSQIPTLCATLGDPSEHFCTAMCSPEDAGPDAAFPKDCGENATCQCQGSQCGCFPASCF
ncbi:MAG TPA: hypothetical protein VHS09_10265 [Polyangiaceae bacterium]|jgi:hypothetical protein|nr:hypothetical protein [Polyangiaceae bacterium]